MDDRPKTTDPLPQEEDDTDSTGAGTREDVGVSAEGRPETEAGPAVPHPAAGAVDRGRAGSLSDAATGTEPEKT